MWHKTKLTHHTESLFCLPNITPAYGNMEYAHWFKKYGLRCKLGAKVSSDRYGKLMSD